MEIARELELAELGAFAQPLGVTAPPLKRIRHHHHLVARLLAAGMRPMDVSAVAGVCPSKISIYQADPAFQELLDHYAQAEYEAFASVREQLENLGVAAAEELMHRLDANPDELGTKALVDILTSALDRAGHAPVKRVERKTAHLHLTPADLAEIKKVKENAASARIIDGEAKREEPGLASPKAIARGEGEGEGIRESLRSRIIPRAQDRNASGAALRLDLDFLFGSSN